MCNTVDKYEDEELFQAITALTGLRRRSAAQFERYEDLILEYSHRINQGRDGYSGAHLSTLR